MKAVKNGKKTVRAMKKVLTTSTKLSKQISSLDSVTKAKLAAINNLFGTGLAAAVKHLDQAIASEKERIKVEKLQAKILKKANKDNKKSAKADK